VGGGTGVFMVGAVVVGCGLAVPGTGLRAEFPAAPSSGEAGLTAFPIVLPLTTSSTRRLSCRPAALSLDATG
jgi:hypothetical protein